MSKANSRDQMVKQTEQQATQRVPIAVIVISVILFVAVTLALISVYRVSIERGNLSLFYQSTAIAILGLGATIFGIIYTARYHNHIADELYHVNQNLQHEIEERQRIENMLRERETHLRSVIASNVDGMIVVRCDGHVCFANPAAGHLLEQDIETLLNKPFGLPLVNGASTEIQIPSKDDQPKLVEMRTMPTRWDQEPAHLISLRDITERRRTEALLRIKDAAIATSINGIALSNLEGQLTYVNRAFLDLWGYEAEQDVLGHSVAEFWATPEDAWQVVEALQSTGHWIGQLVARRKDGSLRDVQLAASLVTDEDNQPLCMMSSFVDVTDQTQMEQALRESEERFRMVLETSTDVAYRRNLQTDAYDYMSPAIAPISGLTATEMMTMPVEKVLELIHPDDLANTNQALAAMRPGETYRIEYRFRHQNGEYRWFEDLFTIVEGQEEETRFRVGRVRDITQRHQAEQELERIHRDLEIKAAELARANQELAQYAYVVSHDLRAPLRAIRNYADFLHEDLEHTLDGDQALYLDGLTTAVSEAEAFVRDLLELSRIGRRHLQIDTVNLGTFLKEMFFVLNPPDNVEIILADTWPTVEIEPILAGQIFQNLVSNAIKFNRSPHKHVELGWQSSEEGMYELYVRDNGIGIEPQYQERIFRVFERLHTTAEYEGTGIGLAIVKKAVGRLGGSVRVESQLGQGSTFFVTLPEHIELTPEEGAS